MNKRDQIIFDAEQYYEMKLDSNFTPPDGEGLCNDDNCRSDECECWERFEEAVRESLLLRAMEEK